MSFWKDFCYVDVDREHPSTGARMAWERMRLTQVDKAVAKARSSNIFTTVQRFKDPVSLLQLQRKEEAARRKAARARGGEGTELTHAEKTKEVDDRPDKQVHYHGIYFDIDSDPKKLGCTDDEALARSLDDVRKLLTFFRDRFPALKEPWLQVWYSGRKGFHLIARPEPFDIRPHRHLSYIVKMVSAELQTGLGMQGIDPAVYSIPRMWRIANTVHPKSGQYKIELRWLEVFNWTTEQIREAARRPRGQSNEALPNSHIFSDADYADIPVDVTAAAWWQDHLQAYEGQEELKKLRPRRPIVRPDEGGDWPVCVQDILKNGPKEGSDAPRNKVVLPVISFFKDAGVDVEDARRTIDEFNHAHYRDNDLEQKTRRNKDRGITDLVYRTDYYHFACRYIRSLSGTGDNGRVACVGEHKCPWVGDPIDQEPATIPVIHLSEATKGCYIGTTVKTEVHVAAVAKAPYGLLVKGQILCTPDPEAAICQRCTNRMEEGCGKGQLEFTVSSDEREALMLFNIEDDSQKGAIKKKCGIPHDCRKHKIVPLSFSNVEELQVIPMVDSNQAFATSTEEPDLIKSRGQRNVVRTAFHVGHGIEPNKKYRIEATVWNHPRNQSMCFVFEKAEAAQDDISQFEMTAELYQKLQIFQPKQGQSIKDKLEEIHADFTANVHQIGGRMPLSIAVDLCYHSVIGFRMFGKDVHKGWFELLVVGDSSTGKTTLVERIRQHFGLGELVSGEDARRTGLVFANIQIQGQWTIQWGKIPQNDRRLLIIDEFSGIPPEEVAKLTQLRSEGIARGTGSTASHETWARTRLILLTNPRDHNGMLGGHSYGIQAIESLFTHAADIRRVDMAIIVSRDEVSTALLNKRWDQTESVHRYTSHLCKSLVLWAWSREPHQIKWQAGAEDEIARLSQSLGDTYDCDIQLAERSDLKNKIARISCALAARLFSTDAEGKQLLVTVDHVRYTADFLDQQLYRSGSMNYFAYAKKFKKTNKFTEDKCKDVLRMLKASPNFEHTVSTMLDMEIFTKTALFENLSYDKEDFEKIWRFLKNEQLLVMKGGRLRRTVGFTRFLRNLGVGGTGFEPEKPELELKEQKEDEAPSNPPHWTESEDWGDGSSGAGGGEEPPF